jgi:Ser/Thr protein kinase RdoA (MazF antagonist)
MSVPPDEYPLSGGNASSFVVRVGGTVRKPWLASTPTVQRLLDHLRATVGEDVPEPGGRDADGRQILEFVAGAAAMDAMPMRPEEVERVGAIIRALHDASATFPRRPTDIWIPAMRQPGDEIIGHSDLAPWNLIRGGARWVFIDWDGAAPTTRIADLAYAARAFAQIDPGHPLDRSLPLVRAILDGYEATADQRAQVTAAMIERTEAMRDLLVTARATGDQPWADMADDGHADYWAGAADHLRRHRAEIENAVRRVPGR